MAIERELRLMLQHAHLPARNEDHNYSETTLSKREVESPMQIPVRTIYDRLHHLRYQDTLPSFSAMREFHLPELLALTAEAGVFQGDFDVARACVEWFLSVCNSKNQFYCRIQVVRAHCASMDATNDVGAIRLKKVLNAIHFILLVIPIATDAKRRPHYDFLVYNASVAYWQISRQLMKKSTFQFLLPSLTSIIDALKVVGEKDVRWLMQLQLALVHAQIDAEQLAAAAKTICAIVDVQLSAMPSDPSISNDPSIVALHEEALRLQVHVGSFKDPESQKVLTNLKKTTSTKRVSLIMKLQALKSGTLTGTPETALLEIFQEVTGMTSFTVATSTDEDIIAHLRGLDTAAGNGIDAEIAAEAGIIAAFRHEYRLATCFDVVLQTRGKAVEPKSRVLHQVLKAIMIALVPPPPSAYFKLTCRERAGLLLNRRLEGIRAIERALLASKRQQDPTLVENVCLYAWNLALPLLQPLTRDHLSRLFSLAASLLEELQSLQLNLRARLMLELGKLELSSQFVAKAQKVVEKAITLDYGTTNASSGLSLDDLLSNEPKWMRRPLDVHLLPLQKRLQAKLSAEDPVSNSTKLASALEQLRDSKDLSHRKREMDCVISIVEAMHEQGKSNSLPMDLDLLLHLNTASTIAWCEMKDAKAARRLTSDALRLFFADGVEQHDNGDDETEFHDKSVMVLEVDLRLRMVEVIGHELKERAKKHEVSVMEGSLASTERKKLSILRKDKGGNLKPLSDSARDSSVLYLLSKEDYVLGLSSPPLDPPQSTDASAIICATEVQKELISLKTELLRQLALALRAATRIGWLFVIENAATYIWNYHFHIFRTLIVRPRELASPSSILLECITVFETALAGLEALPSTSGCLDLLANIALGLALTYENSGKLDKAMSITDSILKRIKASSTSLPTTQMPAQSISLVLLKWFGQLKVRIQVQQNVKEITPVEIAPQIKVVSFLEAMEATLRQSNATLTPTQQNQLTDKATNFFQRALGSWQLVARDSFNQMRNVHLLLEDQQQHLEICCEVWVRLACGAFRFHNTKQAIEYAERALDPVVRAMSLEERGVWMTKSSWKWLAIAELLYARSILTLLSGETAAWPLLEATAMHLVHSAQYAFQGNAGSVIMKCGEVALNTTVTAISAVEAERAVGESSEDKEQARWWSRLLPLLHDILKAIQLSVQERGWLLGEFGLLVLDVCKRADDWNTGMQIAESLVQTASENIQAGHLKEIMTYRAIAAAAVGDSSGVLPAKGGKREDRDALTQIKILRNIAFSSGRNPPTQLQMFAVALSELDGMLEEQVLIMLDIAEWFLTNRFPMQEVQAYLETPQIILVRAHQMAKANRNEEAHGERNDFGGIGSKLGNSHQYPLLWYDDKLVRIFTMRAAVASTGHERCIFIRHAVHIVFHAWQCIVDVANEDDLKLRFTADSPGNQTSEYEEWRVGKSPKHSTKAPDTIKAWLGFYQQYAVGTGNRFFLQWVPPLATQEESASRRSFSNPVLTCSLLERLAQMTISVGWSELALPILCLYQVVYHCCCPQKSKAVELWIELTTYDSLETMNLPSMNIPLQTALELLQSSGDKILSELQEDEVEGDEVAPAVRAESRHRAVIRQHSVSVSEKVAQSADLLLQFGYVRQAKVLLAMLANVAARPSGSRIIQQQCEGLNTRVSVLEGDVVDAERRLDMLACGSHFEVQDYVRLVLLSSKLTIDENKAVETLINAERIVASAIVRASECVELNRPMQQQAITKYISHLKNSHQHAMTVDIDGIESLARLKFRRACLLLQSGGTTSSVEHSVGIFHEAAELVRFVEFKRTHAYFNVRFAQLLVDHFTRCDSSTHSRYREDWLKDARSLLCEALLLLESVRSVPFEPASSLRGGCNVPLEVEIGKVNVLLADVELRLIENTAVVVEQQMTWYKYERAARRNIVEKWLDKTAEQADTDQPGSASKALAFTSAAMCALAGAPESLETRNLAQILRTKCQRFELYFSRDVEAREATRRLLWTRFTSTDAPHMTWICAASYNATVEEGRSTPAPVPTDDASLDPKDAHLLGELGVLAAELENMLKLAIEKRHYHVVQVSAFEAALVYGCNQPILAGRSLLLYQSIVMHQQRMKPLIERCLVSSNVTKLHLHRVQRLTQRHTNAFHNSLPFQLSQLYLDQQADIYKRMSVSIPVESIIAILPSSTRVLSLQLSPDRNFLFAVMVSGGEKTVVMGRMECTSPKLDLLTSLNRRIHGWREKVSKALVSGQDSVTFAGEGDVNEFTTMDLALEPAVDLLEEEFSVIVDETMLFLGPLFEHSAFKGILERELPGCILSLIVDRELELLPLEAMPIFERVEGISRDFSIHLLYHRLVALKSQPFRKDDVRVIVDPRHEDPGLNDSTLTSVFHQFTKKPGAVFMSWKEAAEHSCPPTATDWQQGMLLRKAGALVYAGPNRVVGSAVSLQNLAGMNLGASCYALLLLDRAENQSTARRQSKIDSGKSQTELSLEEDPFTCALLCSLCGINAVLLNQWTTTFNANRRLASGLLGGLAKGQSIAKAVRKYAEGAVPVVAAPSSPARKGPTIASATQTKYRLKSRIRFNTIVFGLGHLTFKTGE